MKPKQLLFPLNIFLFSTLLFISGNVSAAKISCLLPSGEVIETYKSTCNSKEGVEVAKVASAEDLVERLILASASVFPLRNFLRNYCRASHGDLLSRSVKP